ncbi:alpha/beta hydrolase fold protein [Xylanimonas cellulosilytica DSM 15894]|uniref:Alpha/beta hydrolase fold protein n=1 Tax=Xylanimonas cellulosilytica (strain DSM 15894 / JCM 12276 / CECT 5975 / KCTC 9989 / LMG 20990 / NBRC 107835 / XIL07) TaxID=446471 RepID=D1BTT0_XYLCX|nr:alpha/beta hydrolase [Xylanimonas cellulosilytica]ACZ31059.1 alpha/beta hydrolase fold protein [Xylanimonas cellulosilytica DSM 15894]
MAFVTTDDGAGIFYTDWGADGSPVLLSHGWPLSSDAWAAAALFLAEHGHRAIAHDRRGHGRSDRTWHGNEMDTYADDLACLIDTLDLRDLTLVGHSTGGGEVVRYVARHGTDRVARVVLVSAVPPFMLRTDDNPDGLPAEVFDQIRAGEKADRSQLYRTLADGPFFGHNRRGDVDQGFRDAFWLQSMACGHRAAYECIAAFSATDFRPDLAKIDVPVLVIHGDDDQIVPFDVGGRRTVELVDGARLLTYAGSGHALPDTDRDRLHADLLTFIDS